jgi:glycolate oxidase iron-sulfur subunit
MQTNLAAWIKGSPDGETADRVLRACVHCGFCTATCPTYQVLGDELDGPRGRIYQIKQVLEDAEPTRATQIHLDRCLTCRACETTCPSGVEYGRLIDIGREVVEQRVARPMHERLYRWLLREGLTRRWLFGGTLRLARALRFALPAALRLKVGIANDPGAWPTRAHARKVLVLNGCVQPVMSPTIDAATARVLDAVGVGVIVEPHSGCCGAMRHHLNDHSGALGNIRRNIDAWWPHIERGVEAIVINASGCGAMIKDYPYLLRGESDYAAKARTIAGLTHDLAEFLRPVIPEIAARARSPEVRRLAFHPPCTLQHGQQIRGVVESLLMSLGAELVTVSDSHLCCGSAGPYSLLQPQLARTLRDRKLACLSQQHPQRILSANIGCLAHLQSGTDLPVRHWIEWVDELLS